MSDETKKEDGKSKGVGSAMADKIKENLGDNVAFEQPDGSLKSLDEVAKEVDAETASVTPIKNESDDANVQKDEPLDPQVAVDAEAGGVPETKLDLFDGTQCYACYATFAKKTTEDGTFKIGIRPLFGWTNNQTYFGFRIRAIPVGEGDTPTADFQNGKSIQAAFEHFPFQKIAKERCSLMGGVYCNRGSAQPGHVKAWFEEQGIMRKILNRLKEGVGGELAQEDEVGNFLWDAYTKEFNSSIPVEEGGSMEGTPAAVVELSQWKAYKNLKEHKGENVEGPEPTPCYEDSPEASEEDVFGDEGDGDDV